MTDSLWRMTWALPLVLTLGVLALLILKRVLQRTAPATPDVPMTLRQSLKLSDGAQLHLVSLSGQSILIVESSGAPAVHVLPNAAPSVPRWPVLTRTGRS